jgi:hypothetical protein
MKGKFIMKNTRTYRGLASTVSVGALAISSAIPTVASAQQAGVSTQDSPRGMTLSFEGGASVSDFTSDFFDGGESKFGSFENDLGFYGSVAISKSIPNDWDWKISASHIGFPENSSTTGFFPDPFTTVTTYGSGEFSATVADFEMGRNWRRGQTDTRLGFGVIGGRVDQSFGFGGVAQDKFGDLSGVDLLIDSSFIGFGPKLSASISHRFQPTSPFRLVAGASVASMVGNYTHDKGFGAFDTSIPDSIAISTSETDRGTLLMSSAYIGLAYDFSADSSLRVGVRADKFDSSNVDTFGSDVPGLFEDTLATTAYVGVDIKF